jgi:hypothetical protein
MSEESRSRIAIGDGLEVMIVEKSANVTSRQTKRLKLVEEFSGRESWNWFRYWRNACQK